MCVCLFLFVCFFVCLFFLIVGLLKTDLILNKNIMVLIRGKRGAMDR